MVAACGRPIRRPGGGGDRWRKRSLRVNDDRYCSRAGFAFGFPSSGRIRRNTIERADRSGIPTRGRDGVSCFREGREGDLWRRIRATKGGSPCEGFFGGDEVAAIYDVDVITLTTGARTCRLDIEEISSQGGDAAAGTMRGRPRREPRRRCLGGGAPVRPRATAPADC